MRLGVCANFDCLNVSIPEGPPQIKIGGYTLAACEIGKIWIGDENGEGGLFEEDKVEQAIKEFYSENF